jgi:hypothetical protein
MYAAARCPPSEGPDDPGHAARFSHRAVLMEAQAFIHAGLYGRGNAKETRGLFHQDILQRTGGIRWRANCGGCRWMLFRVRSGSNGRHGGRVVPAGRPQGRVFLRHVRNGRVVPGCSSVAGHGRWIRYVEPPLR